MTHRHTLSLSTKEGDITVTVEVDGDDWYIYDWEPNIKSRWVKADVYQRVKQIVTDNWEEFKCVL